MRKRAFTLIELLVVIAIIAILAAILFPVFAQAKQAAKKAQDLSNTKQIALSTNIYTTDVDDILPVEYTNVGTCLPIDATKCGFRTQWQFALYPYIKNWNMMTAPGETTSNQSVIDSFCLSYGYNYGYLSTLCVANDSYSQTNLGCPATDVGAPNAGQFYMSISATSVSRPANIVLFADGGGKDLNIDPVNGSPLGSIVNAPDAYISLKYFWGPAGVGWGKGCDNYFAKARGAKTGKWQDTDGFAPRYGDVGPAVFVDSHAKPMKVGNLASGTNWSAAILCPAVRVTDYSKYQWDPRYDTGTQQ